MQFTPQQLTGGPRYQHCTRLGNWSEDHELEEIKMKDFLKQKESGQLKVTAKQQQLEECLMTTSLSTTAEDGSLRFGQKVMINSAQTKGYLSVNPYDQVPKESPAYMITSSLRSEPSVRNVFTIVRANYNDGFGDDDVVHYGQDIRCVLEPFGQTIVTPTYLHSEMVTGLAAAKFSRHQEVIANSSPNGETIWQLLYPDVNDRFEMEHEPVPDGSPLVIRHVQTGSFLATDEITYTNLFGRENEVHCFPYFSLNKTQNLTSEKKGDITGDVPLRKHGLPNIWHVSTSSEQ